MSITRAHKTEISACIVCYFLICKRTTTVYNRIVKGMEEEKLRSVPMSGHTTVLPGDQKDDEEEDVGVFKGLTFY